MTLRADIVRGDISHWGRVPARSDQHQMSSVFRPLRSGKSSDSISWEYSCAQVVRTRHALVPLRDPLLMSQCADDKDFPRNAMSAMILGLSASSLLHPVFRGCVPGLANDRGTAGLIVRFPVLDTPAWNRSAARCILHVANHSWLPGSQLRQGCPSSYRIPYTVYRRP
jgi:hypothetical protein